MGTTIKLDNGLKKFTFKDEDGDVFASFRINPASPGLAKRAEEVANYFEQREKTVSEISSVDEWKKFSDEIEKKIVDLLGYDAHDDLFGVVEAATVLPDGSVFAMAVLDVIADTIEPEITRRAEQVQAKADYYAAKYNS